MQIELNDFGDIIERNTTNRSEKIRRVPAGEFLSSQRKLNEEPTGNGLESDSRPASRQTNKDDKSVHTPMTSHGFTTRDFSGLPNVDDLRCLQESEPDFDFWWAWVHYGKEPTRSEIVSWKFDWWKRDQDRVLLNENNLLTRTAHLQTTARSQLIRQFLIPRVCIRDVLYWFHDRMNHFGFDRCFNKLRLTCYWLGMDKDVRAYLAACTCHNVKYKKPIDNVEMGSLIASSPNDLVAIDCAGPLRRTSKGHTHVIVMIDHFSKFVEVIPSVQPTGALIMQSLLQLWILRYGPPSRLLSDNGPEFQNVDVREKLCETFGINKVYITPLHPQGNGVVERMMRPVKTALTVFMSVQSSREWDASFTNICLCL